MRSSPDPKRKYGLPEVIAFVNEITAYWREMAHRNSGQLHHMRK